MSFIKKSVQIQRVFITAIFISALFLSIFSLQGNAQEEVNSNTNSSPTPTASVTPESSPTPIPLSDVISQAEQTTKKLREVEEKLSENSSILTINQELPNLAKELDEKETATAKSLSGRSSLQLLNSIEKEWKTLVGNITEWKSSLQTQTTEIDKQTEELKKIASIWQETLNTINEEKLVADSTADVPEEVKEKIKETINAIKKTQTKIGEKRADLLTLQARVSEQEKRINDVLERVKNAREDALSHLFVRDSPAIWYLLSSPKNFSQDVGNSFSEQLKSLNDYAFQQSERFLIHAVILLLLILGLYRARARINPLVEEEPKLKRAMTVFNMPIASALILSIIFSSWLYPQAPSILRALLGAAALVPGIILLRHLIERPVFPILNALVIFYFIDRLREITESLPIISRVLFLTEMLGAIIFLVWLLRSKRLTDKVEVQHFRVASIVRKTIPFAIAIFASAFITNTFGYVSLSRIIGNGILGSAYAALILYAAVQIVESLLVFAFRVRPLSKLGMVKTHRFLIQHRIFQILQWAAIIVWIVFTLNFLSIREAVFGFIKDIFTTALTIGSLSISLIDVLAFLFTVWLAFMLSRLVRFVLEEDVYPRVELSGGVPYAISTILHYILLLLGFLAAIAVLGIDLSKFTILAGAFGVGLGFGLQNIVNNFVSGLILLFERPVKVGDMIQMGERQGDLRQIGLRASVMRSLEGAEVIVPNGHLISEEVINWTRSDPRRRLDITVGVKYGTDPEKVIELLEAVAKKHPEVVTEPIPRTLFLGFGDNSLNFQFRAWTASHDQWQIVKSDLAVGIWKTLKEADIEVPFPQRDLHLKSVNEDVFKIMNPPQVKDEKEAK